MDELLDAAFVGRQIKDWEESQSDWREDAVAAFDFVAGEQWSESDEQAMLDAGRPIVSLNLVTAFVRGICGLEVGNRQEARYLPREMGDVHANEVLDAGARWVRDECSAADEESEAFRDLVICGIGAVETRICYAEDPAGKVLIERLDPLSVAWDPTARKRGLTDARWVATWKRLPYSEILRMWPDAGETLAGEESEYDEMDPAAEPHDREAARYYQGGTGGRDSSRGIKVTQYQYFQDVQYMRVSAPGGQTMDVPADKWQAIAAKAQMFGVQARPMSKRVYRQAFVAKSTLLEDSELPVQRFTICFLTGFRDRNKGSWYGFVRDVQEPQRYINKMYSLGLDILASQAKGGLLAEKSAFENPRQAEEDWSNPRRIIWMREGGTQKITPRESGSLPAALQQIFESTVELFPRISGVSVEFLGTADRAQAGILEHQRKQSTITTLAELFASLTLYRKQAGKVLSEFIVKFLADGRLIRIVGKQNEQYVPLLLQPGATEFDVVVDEAPQSADVKMRTYAVLEQLLPLALQGGIPVPPSVVDYMPIPASLASEWKKLLGGPRVPPEIQMQIEQGKMLIGKLQAENQKLKSDQSAKMAQLQADYQAKLQELAMEQQNTSAEMRLKAEMAQIDAQLEAEKAAADIILQREKWLADWQLKAAEAAARTDLEQARANNDTAKIAADQKRAETDAQIAQLADRLDNVVQMAGRKKRRNVRVQRDRSGRIVSALVEEVAEEEA